MSKCTPSRSFFIVLQQDIVQLFFGFHCDFIFNQARRKIPLLQSELLDKRMLQDTLQDPVKDSAAAHESSQVRSRT